MPFLEVYKEKCSQLCCDPITSLVDATDPECALVQWSSSLRHTWRATYSNSKAETVSSSIPLALMWIVVQDCAAFHDWSLGWMDGWILTGSHLQ